MHPSLSLEKSKIKILLLEGVDPSAVEALKNSKNYILLKEDDYFALFEKVELEEEYA